MGAMTRHQKWCPTCGRELADVVSMAEREGYDVENGVVHSSPGFLNISISPEKATVEYVKTVEDCAVADCSYIADSYTVTAD